MRALCLLPSFLLVACDASEPSIGEAFAAVCPGELIADAVSVPVGERERLTLQFPGPTTERPLVTWQSENEGVARVDSLGTVFGEGLGRTYVVGSAELNGWTIPCDTASVRVEWERELGGRGTRLWDVGSLHGPIWALQGGALVVSQDEGETWEERFSESAFASVLGGFPRALQASHQDPERLVVYAAGAGGSPLLALSGDGGRSWERVSDRLPLVRNVDHLAATFAGDDPSTLYVVGRSNAFDFYRSTDFGATWSYRGSTLQYANDGGFPRLFASPFTPGLVYLRANSVHVSADAARSWAALAPAGPAPVQYLAEHLDASGRLFTSSYNIGGTRAREVGRYDPATGYAALLDIEGGVRDISAFPRPSGVLAILHNVDWTNRGSRLATSVDDGQTWATVPIPRSFLGEGLRVRILSPDPFEALVEIDGQQLPGIWRYRRAD